MGKVETNKKQKNTTLLQTSFELFTEKGFTKTTISDIVNRAGLAKGTFYLYFKDKYDLRDRTKMHSWLLRTLLFSLRIVFPSDVL